jgi:class 3 adenylate cyclase
VPAEQAPEPQETQRRRATVMFADITGFTALVQRLGDERAYGIVTGCLRLLDEIARRHGAAVDKYMGDCVMAVFGVPTALEQAPRVAVNAAIEMIRRVAEWNAEQGVDPPLGLHVGINSGWLIRGDVSGPLLREFAVMGNAVNVSARLKDLAPPGRIWVGAETWRETRHEFEYRPLPPFDVKGQHFDGAHELLSTRERIYGSRPREVSAPLVGRDAELEELRRQIAELRAGRGGIVSLAGEAGIGKSRLLAELAPEVESAGVSWIEGRCVSVGHRLRFHPFVDLLRRWSGVRDEDPDEVAFARLAEAVAGAAPEEAGELMPILAALTGIRPPASARLPDESLPGDALEKLVLRSATTLLRRLASARPLVLVVDDLHWADLASVELLLPLLRLAGSDPILFLLGFRPHFDETSERVRRFALQHHAGDYHEIALAPLEANAARKLVEEIFRGGELARATRDLILARAQGNPFYVEEVVRSLIDQGAVEVTRAGLRATERIRSVEIPGTIDEVLTSRIDRLAAPLRLVLQMAAVIGPVFDERVLSHALGGAEVEGELRKLVELELAAPRPADGEYGFRHPLIQEVAYRATLEQRRREHHGRIGRAIEAVLAPSTPGYHAMLAYHYSLAGELERAEACLFDAGDEAARSAAPNEALHFFQEASRVYLARHGEGGESRKKALLEKNVALAFFNRGQLQEGIEHFHAALAHLGVTTPRSTRRAALRFAANFGAVLASLYAPRRSERRPPASDVEREIIDLMFKRAWAQTTASPTRFLFDSMEAVRRVARVDPHSVPESAALYAGAVGPFSYGGLSFAIGRRFLERARELAEAGHVRDLVLYYRLVGFLHHLLEGDWSDAHEVEEELLEEGLRTGRLWEVTTYLNLDGVRRIYRGEWDAAAERIERLGKVADLFQHELALSAQHALVAFLRLERRELGRALEAVEHYYDEHRERAFNVSALGTRAKIQVLLGELDEAARSLADAELLARQAGRVPAYHAGAWLSARYLHDVARLERALDERDGRGARQARAAAAKSRGPALRSARRVRWREPEVLRTAGRHAWLRGRRREALRGWGRSLAASERIGMRAEAARTWLEAGERLATSGGSLEGLDAAACRAEGERRLAALGLGSGAETERP